MKLLTKFLSNQINILDFLKEADGKSFLTGETAINFITTGLENVMDKYNDAHTDYISYGMIDNGNYLQYSITYYERKKNMKHQLKKLDSQAKSVSKPRYQKKNWSKMISNITMLEKTETEINII